MFRSGSLSFNEDSYCIGRSHEKLVKEFIVNLTIECNVEGRKEFIKVYVRGKCVDFSLLS